MKYRTIERIDWLLMCAGEGRRVEKQVDRMKRTLKKKGFLEVDSTSVTCFNYSPNHSEPKEDGTFDKMGHSAEDVNVVLDNEWWNPKRKDEFFLFQLKNFAKNLYEFASYKYMIYDLFQVRSARDLRDWFGKVKKRFRAWVLDEHPFSNSVTRWVFVADSMKASLESAAYEMAEDILAKRKGYKNSNSLFKARREIADTKDAKEIADQLIETDKEMVIRHIEQKQGMQKWNDVLWVNTNDPACFILDETNGPVQFKMRDGWSREQIAEVIKYYLDTLFPVEAGWVVRVTKREEGKDA